MNVQAGGPPVGERKSPWNSLEIAKIFMGLATPLALFGLGWGAKQMEDARVKLDSEAKETEAEKKARKAEEKLDKEKERTIALQEKIRTDEKEFQKRLQDREVESQISLQREQFARDRTARDEAFEHEQAIRKQQSELIRTTKMAEKRVEFWSQLAPKLASIDAEFISLVLKTGDTEKITHLFEEGDELFALYDPYFTPNFRTRYELYRETIKGGLGLFANPQDKLNYKKGLAFLPEGCVQYALLRDIAGREIALASELLSESEKKRKPVESDDERIHAIRFRCEKRQLETYHKGVRSGVIEEGTPLKLG